MVRILGIDLTGPVSLRQPGADAEDRLADCATALGQCDILAVRVIPADDDLAVAGKACIVGVRAIDFAKGLAFRRTQAQPSDLFCPVVEGTGTAVGASLEMLVAKGGRVRAHTIDQVVRRKRSLGSQVGAVIAAHRRQLETDNAKQPDGHNDDRDQHLHQRKAMLATPLSSVSHRRRPLAHVFR